MRDRLSDYRRKRSYSYSRSEAPASLDINVRAYEIICAIERCADRTFGRILPALIAERNGLSSAGRRVLLRTLKKAAERQRADAERAAQRAQRYEAFAARLEAPDLAPENPTAHHHPTNQRNP